MHLHKILLLISFVGFLAGGDVAWARTRSTAIAPQRPRSVESLRGSKLKVYLPVRARPLTGKALDQALNSSGELSEMVRKAVAGAVASFLESTDVQLSDGISVLEIRSNGPRNYFGRNQGGETPHRATVEIGQGADRVAMDVVFLLRGAPQQAPGKGDKRPPFFYSVGELKILLKELIKTRPVAAATSRSSSPSGSPG